MTPEVVEERARCLQIVRGVRQTLVEGMTIGAAQDTPAYQMTDRACLVITRAILSGQSDPEEAVVVALDELEPRP